MTALVLHAVEKSYGPTRALRSVDLELPAGEIIGIAGPNGAGKSTLTRILAGEERSDAGSFVLDGRAWDPFEARGKVAVVHQEPQVWPNLSIRDNLRVGREGSAFFIHSQAREDFAILEQLQLLEIRDRPLSQCTLAVQQRVEIARAMVSRARCFIFDEPNSALTDEDSAALFTFMRELAHAGHVVLLISHRLGELVKHCSRVIIVRDGVPARTLTGDDLTEVAIAAELVVDSANATLDPPHTAKASGAAAPQLPTGEVFRSDVVSVTNWSSPYGAFVDIDLVLRSGEVTAIMGAEGSGARELLGSLGGFDRATGARSVHRDSRTEGRDTVTFLPADRKGMLFPNLTVGDNLVVRLGRPRIADAAGMLRPTRIRSLTGHAIRAFGIKTQGAQQPIVALSGGNQQKIAIAAALLSNPAALIVIEPTRGVDIASKRGIYSTLRQSSREGLAVVVLCTEVPETYEVADRVVVIDRGVIVMDSRVDLFQDVTELAVAIAATTGSDALISPKQLKGKQ